MHVKEQESKKQELAKIAGSIDPNWIFIYIRDKPISVIPDAIPIMVKTGDTIIPLSENKTLAIHKLVDLDFYDPRIYTKSDYSDQVAKAFEKI